MIKIIELNNRNNIRYNDEDSERSGRGAFDVELAGGRADEEVGVGEFREQGEGAGAGGQLDAILYQAGPAQYFLQKQ